MLILISELSKFSIITFYLCENPSLNTWEIKLPSSESNPKSILHRRRPFKPSYFSDLVLPCLLSFAPQLQHSLHRLPHAIRSGMIAKHLAFIQPAILVPFSNRIFFCLRRLNMFPSFHRKFAMCYILMAITIARLIGVRNTNIHQKTWGRCLRVWCSKFLEFSFWILVKNSK
jgi:hypothetical protein